MKGMNYTMHACSYTETTDYIVVNATLNVDKKCFRIDIVNDSITEAVETFHLSLEKVFSEDDVTFINQSLTIVIIDDGRLKLRRAVLALF